MKIKIATLALALTGVAASYAQSARIEPRTPCGTSELYNQSIIDHPEILIQQQKLEEFTQKFIANQATQKTAMVSYVIPMVFHVVHNYGPENISDAQIYDAVSILTRDYNLKNPDTANIYSTFKALQANVGFTFKLAQIDPNGNCTNGIDRIPNLKTYTGSDAAKFNAWPSNKYLNVWVVNKISSGAAGYAFYPGSTSSTNDGIMILYDYVGSTGASTVGTSRALTHEVGHFFNLQHVWGSNNTPGVSCGNDGVTDTPVTKGWDHCPTSAQAAVCTSGIVENYENYMEYSYCGNHMFTKAQATRMVAAANSSIGSRSSLWTTGNQTATGVSAAPNLCKADFTINRNEVCENGTVTFTDASWNGTPTSYTWSFPGGTPSTATTSPVTVTYAAAGTYNVTLTASNGTSSPSVTKTNLVKVYPAASSQGLPFAEGFEGVILPNSTWTVNNTDNKATWTTTSSAHYTGNSCMYIANATNDTAQVDEIESPALDFTTLGSPKLYYKVAYAQKDASSNDALRVMVSTNCGVSWSAKQIKAGNKLMSVTPQTGTFTPTLTSQWRPDSVILTSYAAVKNVRIKFQFTNADGNNIYIDDINITGSTLTGIDNPLANTINFNVYPNPVQDRSVVDFNLVDKAKVSVNIYDILGKEVGKLVDRQQLSAGEHKYPFNTTGMNSGIYFVKLMVNDQLFVEKVIVQ
jgi:PKD repeat protein